MVIDHKDHKKACKANKSSMSRYPKGKRQSHNDNKSHNFSHNLYEMLFLTFRHS